MSVHCIHAAESDEDGEMMGFYPENGVEEYRYGGFVEEDGDDDDEGVADEDEKADEGSPVARVGIVIVAHAFEVVIVCVCIVQSAL